MEVPLNKLKLPCLTCGSSEVEEVECLACAVGWRGVRHNLFRLKPRPLYAWNAAWVAVINKHHQKNDRAKKIRVFAIKMVLDLEPDEEE